MSKIYDYNGGGIDEGVRIRIRIRIKLGINISVKRIVRSSDFLQILVGERSNEDLAIIDKIMIIKESLELKCKYKYKNKNERMREVVRKWKLVQM